METSSEGAQKSDLDWIFAHGPEVAMEPHGASLQALADSKGLGDLWGKSGEGVAYFQNAMAILKLATPYLLASDRAGWLALPKE